MKKAEISYQLTFLFYPQLSRVSFHPSVVPSMKNTRNELYFYDRYTKIVCCETTMSVHEKRKQ